MAAGEYVSVQSQADTEQAELARERTELARRRRERSTSELPESTCAAASSQRSQEPVALQLMARDALGAHARDELGISEELAARPLQAALASAATFAIGAALPILALMASPDGRVGVTVASASLFFLAGLGALAARAGGASALVGAVRVAFWGALAMAATSVVGAMFGAATH